MINVSDLTIPTESTTVDPSDNIFKELGKNTYDLKDLISELIDNSVAARQDDVLLKVESRYMLMVRIIQQSLLLEIMLRGFCQKTLE